ncbi:hypothetical protein NQ318_014547 [Aromia moschata]|uniref:Fibronectin type-III domain-containing protein n=1 Tax=Aromia moschata TaxID=1265417 RepID=A0AAV8XGG6_9CUCU|nr:hypothetical protein NQ318_014547 [Aromia moschata]
MDKIEKLERMFNLKDVSDLEVAPNSNGDKIACNVTNLKVEIPTIGSQVVQLQWDQFKMDDQRKLLGYIIYCIEAPYKIWWVKDVPYHENEPKVYQLLPNLKPYTQYAFYVKTYTIVEEKSEGQEHRVKFMPSSPQNLQVNSNSSDSLKITWLPPARPNGNITHYIISGKKHSNGDMYSKDRNYCKDPPTTKPLTPQIIQPTSPPKNESQCNCVDGSQGSRVSSVNEIEERNRIKFEDELQNQVYVKRQPATPILRDRSADRMKRDTSTSLAFPNSNESHPQTIKNSEIQNVTENGTDIWVSFSFPVYRTTEFFIQKLHHFTYYDINVQACREIVHDDTESSCSSTSMQTKRTMKKPNADDISKVHITNQSLDTVTIEWEQPKDPNGIIFTISVQYKRVDIENAKPTTECITSKDFKKGKMDYTIKKLFPGNYSLRVMATTSAGEGQYSPYIYFYIKEPTPYTMVVVVIVLIIFFVVMVFICWLYRKHQKERENMRLIQSVNPEYVPSVYIPDEWEVPRKKIELIKELGQGSFGMVWEGLAHDIRGKTGN